MLKFSGFHFNKSVLLLTSSLCLMFLAVDASAQTENGKIEEINPRSNERVILEDHTIIHDNSNSLTSPVKLSTPPKTNPSVVKREFNPGEAAGSEKEVKKTDSPSTLSFNIFLYIVDKFKAD